MTPSQRPGIVFICAMECELDAVSRVFANASRSALCGRTVVRGTIVGGTNAAAILSGVGKVNAACAVQIAASGLDADIAITAGVCGGLRESMRPGEVYAVRAAVEYDFDLSRLDSCPVGKLEEFESRELPFCVPEGFTGELLATGDRFRDDDTDYPLLIDDIGAGLRDMEGAAVAHAAIRAGIGVAGLKSVANVRGRGSMHAQYAENRNAALAALSDATEAFAAGMAKLRRDRI